MTSHSRSRDLVAIIPSAGPTPVPRSPSSGPRSGRPSLGRARCSALACSHGDAPGSTTARLMLCRLLHHGSPTPDARSRTNLLHHVALLQLKPDPTVVRLCGGWLARTQERFGLRVYGFCFLSNHLHLLVAAPH